jgi:hypothetical protein
MESKTIACFKPHSGFSKLVSTKSFYTVTTTDGVSVDKCLSAILLKLSITAKSAVIPMAVARARFVGRFQLLRGDYR